MLVRCLLFGCPVRQLNVIDLSACDALPGYKSNSLGFMRFCSWLLSASVHAVMLDRVCCVRAVRSWENQIRISRSTYIYLLFWTCPWCGIKIPAKKSPAISVRLWSPDRPCSCTRLKPRFQDRIAPPLLNLKSKNALLGCAPKKYWTKDFHSLLPQTTSEGIWFNRRKPAKTGKTPRSALLCFVNQNAPELLCLIQWDLTSYHLHALLWLILRDICKYRMSNAVISCVRLGLKQLHRLFHDIFPWALIKLLAEIPW